MIKQPLSLSRTRDLRPLLLTALVFTAVACQPAGQRITAPVSDELTVAVAGNVHPLALDPSGSEPADPGMKLEHLVLHLTSSDAQEAELDQLLEEQASQASGNGERYLTPQEFALRFGVGYEDLAVISGWLARHGLTVEEVSAGGRSILFGGTVAQVAETFHTDFRLFADDQGVARIANTSDPCLPAALAGVVGGVLKLHGFPHVARQPGDEVPQPGASTPNFAPSGVRMLTPGDYQALYDTRPLLAAGYDGAGQGIAVIARSNIYLSDVQSFRTLFNLPANDPQFVITNQDPGQVKGDNLETTLDTEWAGAIAPGAPIKVIISASAGATDGIDTSSIYAVNNKVAPIITLSYGSCEAVMGTTAKKFYDSLWKQAAAQGQTVIVASGDSGAAGCDLGGTAKAVKGKGVNGLCSSSYATCVGGTQLVEGTNPAQYWYPSKPDSTEGTAMGYIPETAWNESASVTGGSGLWASGGGPSATYAKPAWQTGLGVPADGKRDVPDVSLTAAMHDGYTVVQGGFLGFIITEAGTSAAAPSFAGMLSLIEHKVGAPQGNVNPTLYALAARQQKSGPPAFHDVTSGNTNVPGLAGFAATAGYDLATGLGSVDANVLASAWSAVSGGPSLVIYATAQKVNQGQSVTAKVSTLATGLNAAVTVSITDAPAGLAAALATTTVAQPGTGSVNLTVTPDAQLAPGIYTIGLSASAGGQSATTRVAVSVTAPTFVLGYPGGLYPSVMFGPTAPYTPVKLALTTFPANGFSSPIAFTATGMPTGLTVAFSAASVSGKAVASIVATISAAPTLKGGSYKFTITASGGGATQSVEYRADVFVQPSCSLTPDSQSLAFKPGTSATLTLVCKAAKASNTPIALSWRGLPGGITAQMPNSVTPGSTSKIIFTADPGIGPSTYGFNLHGEEVTGAAQDLSLFLAVGVPVFSFSLNPAAPSAKIGSTTTFTATIKPEPGFTAPTDIWIGSRPAGVTVAFGAKDANQSRVLTLTVDKTAVAGSYPLTLGASANTGYSRTITTTLTLKK